MSAHIEISRLTKRYAAHTALEHIDLSIIPGSVLAVLGPNGAGKSTLFGCLLGLTLPTSGSILANGQPITDAHRSRYGYVAERMAMYPQRTVLENAKFFVGLKGHSVATLETQLERVGLAHARERKVRQLSKGMLQRLGLAIALCGEPELLVLDEPFNGLDPALFDTLQAILLEESRRGTTLLIATHTMSPVEPVATQVAILLQGRLAACATLDDLRAEHPEADSLEAIYHRIARQSRRPEEVFA